MLRSAKKHTDKDELFTTNPASSTRLAADPPPRLFKVYATECTVDHTVKFFQWNYQKTVTITKPHEEFMMNNELNPSTDQFAKPLCMPLLNLKVC